MSNNKPNLPFLFDMMAMGVPEKTAKQWHDAIWLLKSHTENLIRVIEEDNKPVMHQASVNAKIALQEMRS